MKTRYVYELKHSVAFKLDVSNLCNIFLCLAFFCNLFCVLILNFDKLLLGLFEQPYVHCVNIPCMIYSVGNSPY